MTSITDKLMWMVMLVSLGLLDNRFSMSIFGLSQLMEYIHSKHHPRISTHPESFIPSSNTIECSDMNS